ncbi:hypothetical protein ACROYT_G012003 [Oculina patagonica]
MVILADVVKGAAEDTIGRRKKRKHRAWISKTTESLVQERKKAKAVIDQFASRRKFEKYCILEQKESERKGTGPYAVIIMVSPFNLFLVRCLATSYQTGCDKSCDHPTAGICMRERKCELFGIEQAWYLTDLDYADVTLLEPRRERGQQVLNSLQQAGEVVGLTISNSRTKTMDFRETEMDIHLDGEVVEVVNHFCSLGSEVMSTG